MRQITIIIPVYNEEKAIKSTFDQLYQVISKLKSELFEIIVINDGSTDKSQDLLKNYPVKIIQHACKLGYGASLKDGITHSKFDILVIMDADGSYPPQEIIRLMKYVGKFSLIIGVRSNYHPIVRQFANKSLALIASILFRKWIVDLNSGLRIFKKQPLLQLNYKTWPNGFSFSTTMTLSLTINNYPVKQIPIRCGLRWGNSKANISQVGLMVLKMLFKFFKLKYTN